VSSVINEETFGDSLSVAAPVYLSGEAKEGGKTFLGGQVYMVANNALRQYGTHTPLFQVSLPFP